MDFHKDIEGKGIALVIYNTEDENDVRVCLGKIIQEDRSFYFIHKKGNWRITLNYELLGRLRMVTTELKEALLQVDYLLSLYMGACLRMPIRMRLRLLELTGKIDNKRPRTSHRKWKLLLGI